MPIKYVINKTTGIELHWIKLNLSKKSISVKGQLVAKIENNGFLTYYKHEDVEDEFQNLMEKWLTKKKEATTVSSRELEMQRRNAPMTTSSHDVKSNKKMRQMKQLEFISSSIFTGRDHRVGNTLRIQRLT